MIAVIKVDSWNSVYANANQKKEGGRREWKKQAGEKTKRQKTR